jgi:hypothetical protein
VATADSSIVRGRCPVGYTVHGVGQPVQRHHLHVVGLAEADRHVLEDPQLGRVDVDQLEVLRVERAEGREPVDRPLVERDQVLAVRVRRCRRGR